MYVSVTEVQSFKRCRRQWEYGSFNRMGITPIIQPKPYLDLGSMIHKTLAYWTQKPDLGTYVIDGREYPVTLATVFVKIAAAHRQAIVAKYKVATGSEPSPEDMAPLLDAITLGTAMMHNYQEYYGEPLPPRLKYCLPEQEILIPIPGTEHPCPDCGIVPGMRVLNPCASCNSTGIQRHYLKARLDALAADKRDNLYIVERKTYDKRPDLSLLEVTDQFIGYVWSAQQLDTGNVVGIAYDGMWKRAVPPQRPKKLALSDLFTRTLITPSQDEVDEYGVELARTVMEMANDPYIYKNRVWQGCWDCSFEYLCRTQSQQGDVDYVLRTMFTTRTEDDTDDIVETVELAANAPT